MHGPWVLGLILHSQEMFSHIIGIITLLFLSRYTYFSHMIFQGFAISKEYQSKVAEFNFHGTSARLRHGDVVIAAITSCTNTSNPSVMLGAALVAKKACELGLEVRCCFLSPFSVQPL